DHRFRQERYVIGSGCGLPESAEHRHRLPTSVEVLGEPQFGHAPCGGCLHVRLDMPGWVFPLGYWRRLFESDMGMEVEVIVSHRSPAPEFDGRPQLRRTDISEDVPRLRRHLVLCFQFGTCQRHGVCHREKGCVRLDCSRHGQPGAVGVASPQGCYRLFEVAQSARHSGAQTSRKRYRRRMSSLSSTAAGFRYQSMAATVDSSGLPSWGVKQNPTNSLPFRTANVSSATTVWERILP